MPRVIGLRSFAQNWSDVIAVFQMPYSHTIGQYSAVSMLVVMNILEKFLRCHGIKNMWETLVVRYIYNSESICVNDL